MNQYMQIALPIPFLGVMQALDKFINMFASSNNDDSASADDADTESESFDNDLDNEFGDDEEGFDSDEEGDDDTKKSTEKETEDVKKKDSSAIFQKKKYREELKMAKKRIEELESATKKRDLTADEQKEKAAKEYLSEAILEVLENLEKEQESEDSSALEVFEEELEGVLDENTDISEKQLLDVCEELDVSPQTALKIIRRESKFKGKEKPKLPMSRRGSGDIEDSETTSKDKKLPTLDEINRRIKSRIQKGLL